MASCPEARGDAASQRPRPPPHPAQREASLRLWEVLDVALFGVTGLPRCNWIMTSR